MYNAFGAVSKKLSPSSQYPRSYRFSAMLSYSIFIFSCFTVRSMIHFYLIFVKDINISRLFFCLFCIWMSSCSRPFVEETIFASLSCLCSFVKCQLLSLCGSISGFSILLPESIVYSFINATIFLITTAV